MVLSVGLSSCASGRAEDDRTTLSALRGGEPSIFWKNTVRLDATCTGVLLHPRLVAYAAHCGSVDVVSNETGEARAVWCASHPDWSAFGLDLAVCEIDRSLDDAIVIPPATGCEVSSILPGTETWLAGYGFTDESGTFGELSTTEATIQEVSETELRVNGPDFGACDGDSGGPAHVAVEDDELRAWRVAGVLSMGVPGVCPVGEAFYVPLWNYLPWIESVSQIDVTPCGGSDGQWDANPACTSWSDDATDLAAYQPSGSCGEPKPPSEPDTDDPHLEIVSATESVTTVAADDFQSGIYFVSLQVWLGDDMVWTKTRSTKPYDFYPEHLTAGERYRFVAEAQDFYGNTALAEVHNSVGEHEKKRKFASSGCSISSANGSGRPLLGVAAIAILRRTRRRRRAT
jgi:hypothetical protein